MGEQTFCSVHNCLDKFCRVKKSFSWFLWNLCFCFLEENKPVNFSGSQNVFFPVTFIYYSSRNRIQESGRKYSEEEKSRDNIHFEFPDLEFSSLVNRELLDDYRQKVYQRSYKDKKFMDWLMKKTRFSLPWEFVIRRENRVENFLYKVDEEWFLSWRSLTLRVEAAFDVVFKVLLNCWANNRFQVLEGKELCKLYDCECWGGVGSYEIEFGS